MDTKRTHRNPIYYAEIVQLIQTKTFEGTGVPEDPYRDVVRYWTFDGKLIATIDPIQENEN